MAALPSELRKMAALPSVLAALPNDLIIKILERLPDSLLLLFRHVSEEWCDLIDSLGLGLFLRQSSSPSLYRNDLRSLREVVGINRPLPLRDCYKIKLLGSCNGRLCISSISSISRKADRVVLWNPATENHKVLPEVKDRDKVPVSRALGFLYYGFGYDESDDDYVLLRLCHLETPQIGSEVRIYSLKKDAWKELSAIPYFPYYVNKMGVFVRGRLHWIMTREMVSDSPKMLVAYDFRTEDLEVLGLPDVINDKLDMNIAVLGECLCLSVCNDHKGVDVWIMTEYGVKKSWTNIISIPQSEFADPLGYVRPLLYSHNGGKDLVKLDDKNLAWYDLETECIVKVDIPDMPSSFEAEICFTTLVSVDDAARNRREGEQEHEG